MDDDDFEMNSDGGQGYNNNNSRGSAKSRQQVEKRPAQRNEEDFEDGDDDESFGGLPRDKDKGLSNKSSGFTSAASKHLQKERSKGTGAEVRRAPVEEEDAGQDDEEDRGPTFRTREALEMSCEFLRLFTIEALHRTAGYQREQEDEELKDDETLIELDSLEAIAPQLVMDF
ncbi:hypothetical protein BGZ95_003491 [Linnemannia exigua]|uniref:Uncharacterized protein n=1 Tax=Linnemannia exigua TaxID=604196 RepID=A0AAD4HB19_9FUNG|nr:hypothetical protein BGZ95_003491 [Linnemannia exigua]